MNPIIAYINRVAHLNEIEVSDVIGSFICSECIHVPVKGFVYGLFVELDRENKLALFNEAIRFNASNHLDHQSWNPIYDNVYALYWGKDKDGLSRIHRHVKNNSVGTGILRLNTYTSLYGKGVVFASVYSSGFAHLEQLLIQNNLPLLKTRTMG